MLGESLAYEIQCLTAAGKLRVHLRGWCAFFFTVIFPGKKKDVEEDFQQPAQKYCSEFMLKPWAAPKSPESQCCHFRSISSLLRAGKDPGLSRPFEKPCAFTYTFLLLWLFQFSRWAFSDMFFISRQKLKVVICLLPCLREKSLFNHRHKAGEECRSERCILILQAGFLRGAGLFPREHACPSRSPLENKSPHTH